MYPLQQTYSRDDLTSLFRVLARSLDYNKIMDDTLWSIINKNTTKIFELLSGASLLKYAERINVTDLVSNYANSVTGATYTKSTKKIAKASHGLSSSSLKKRILLYGTISSVPVAGITTITKIDSINDFTVADAIFSGNIADLSYSVLSHHSSSYLDVSSLNIDKINKLVCSINKNISEVPTNDFEDLSDAYTKSCFYSYEGGFIYLFKGSEVSTFGTLTLSYNRLPILPTSGSEYIDLEEKHIPLLIDLCSLEIYAIAGKEAPIGLSSGAENLTKELREANLSKKAELEQTKTK
ncbi:MAG: hypothetical protein ACP5N7_05620 [Candidatus Pacearchaeota archaeon]